MTTLERADAIICCYMLDPKYVAINEWMGQYGIISQLCGQWPRDEMEAFVGTGEHLNPDREMKLVVHEQPDWDWWEPRYDSPYRREQAREREFGL